MENLEKLEIPTISFTAVTLLGNDASCTCVGAPIQEGQDGAPQNFDEILN